MIHTFHNIVYQAATS